MRHGNLTLRNFPKRRATALGKAVLVRLQPELVKPLDAWRRQQDDAPGRPEAIRRLVEIGLKVRKVRVPREAWTPEEDSILKQEADAGRTVREIASTVGRTEAAVRTRAYTLRVPFAN